MGASESTPATDVREEGPAKPAAYAELISSMSPRAALKAADLSAAQLEELSRRFKALDSDNDGVLVPEEFVKHFGSNVLGRSLFKAFDFDGDGRISIPEFIGALGVLSRGDLRTKLGFAFRMFDHDQDKFVAKTEMQAMLGSVIDTLALVDPRKRKVRPDIIEISNRLFAKLDRNRDGLIDKNEFCEGLASDHEAQALLGMGSNRRSDARFNQRKGHSKELPVSWGQKEWALVVSMMIGMRAAGEAAHERWDSLPKPFKPSPESFTYVNEFEIPSNELVQAGSAYKFEDYAPEVFRALRGMDGVEEDAYLESIGPAQLFARLLLGDLASLTAQVRSDGAGRGWAGPPSAVVSAGKSGSLFFHTPDGRYMAKTIPMREFKPLLKLLPALYGHIEKHGRETMLMREKRIYGLHKINGIPFVVVANVLDTPNELQRLYDLKARAGPLPPQPPARRESDD
eukprot:tig00020944_g16384.t1